MSGNIKITRHAILRFRQRVAKIPASMVPAEMTRLLRRATPIPCPKRQDDGRVYLKTKECTFVMTRSGVIVTVQNDIASDKPFSRKKPPVRRRSRRRILNHHDHP